MPFKFEKLIVWQKAVELSGLVNEVVKTFPRDEIYILTSQIKRAADSVALNIAEGSTGQTNAEYKKFIGYAIRSDMEVVSCIFVAKRRNIIHQQDFQNIYNLCSEILAMSNSLRNSLK